MKIRTIILVALAVICGTSAAVGVNQMANQGRDGTADKVIVTAARSVTRGAVLSAEALSTRPWSSAALPPGAITDIQKATGRTVLVPLVKGEPILEAKLASKDAGRGLASMIPFGLRAFTIRTSHIAATGSGFIMPGDKVDVLLTMTDNSSDDKTGGGETTTLLQNIEVLAVAQLLDAPDSNKVDPKEPANVTLLVSPDQATKLDLGMNKGEIHLSLRNAEDNRSGKTRPATMAELRHDQEPASNSPSQWLALANFLREASRAAAKDSMEKRVVAAKPVVDDKLPAPALSTTTTIQTLRGTERGVIVVERR